MKKDRTTLVKFREGRGLSLEQMAKICRCSQILLYGIEACGYITHPKIAARIAAGYSLDVAGYNDLVSEKHRASRLPRPKLPPKKKDAFEL